MSILVGRIIDGFRKSIQSSLFTIFHYCQGVIFTAFALVVTGTLVIWLSIFIYGAFYYSYMPPATQYTKPVHLQFRPCDDIQGACSFMSANVSLTRKGDEQLFLRGLPYSIQLDIEMPESPANLEAGMFMIKIILYSKKGDPVLTSSRAAVLRYKSRLVQTINAFTSAAALLSGTYEEKQVVNVELVDEYEEDTYHPATTAFVEVQTKFIQVYSSQLRIVAKFTGIRYLLFQYPTISAVCGIGSIMYFLVIIATLSWWRYLGNPAPMYAVSNMFTGSTHNISDENIMSVGASASRVEELQFTDIDTPST